MMQTAGTALAAGAVLVAAYLVGSVPWGYLIGRLNHLDIREHGSGNIGATNVRRVLGRDWGILCFALDLLKGFLPVMVVGIGWITVPGLRPDIARLLAAAGAVAGHIWPVWLRLRGGKGVATTMGALLGVSWFAVVVCVLTWVVVFLFTRYVSLASVCAAVMLPFGYLLQGSLSGELRLDWTLLLLAGLAGLIVLRHRSNLRRLREGTEYRFSRRKAQP
ncbi:MAG: glycerol-3-phosphate 1-O-acyltransferase PlsY [Lentisphaeria bacterium]|nr:glycerol-3-phosphate 1-O-acyltransferase PlsY [Lentisphaeria bacterium]